MREYKEYWKCTWRDKQTISGADFTLDKVYERVNGVLKDDSGFCWKKHPLNMNNVNFVQVEQDSQVEVHSGIGDILYLAVHVGNDRTFIKYGNNNDKIEKVIDREITEDELLAIVKQLEGKSKHKLISEQNGSHYGNMGESTGLKDSLGVELFVGDVVKVFENGREIKETFIVKNDGKCFVMGLKAQTLADDLGFKTQKIKSYEDVVNDEQYGVIKAVRKGNGNE